MDLLRYIPLGSMPILGLALCASSDAGQMALKIGDGAGWHFLGGQWTESPEGTINPPDDRNQPLLAQFMRVTARGIMPLRTRESP